MLYKRYLKYLLSFVAVVAVNLQFILLTIITMAIYPGGTQDDPTVVGYSFWENFFSDTGRTIALNGESNLIASVIFAYALFTLGAFMAVWFVAMPGVFSVSKTARGLSKAAAVIGVVAGISFIGISLVPSNINMDLHMDFVYGGFGTLSVAFILLTAAMFLEKDYPNKYPIVFIVFLTLLISYNWLAVARPLFWGLSELSIQATSQKIIVYAISLCALYQAIGAIKVLKRKYNAVI